MKYLKILNKGDIIKFFQSRLDGPLRIQASDELIDWFRDRLEASELVDLGFNTVASIEINGISVRFQLEPTPYRVDDESNLIPPYLIEKTPTHEISTNNPEYLKAPIELVIAYSETGMTIVGYRR